MANPTPRLVDEGGVIRWRVDLRSRREFGADYGQHWLKAQTSDPMAAAFEALRLLQRLQTEAAAASPNGSLNFDSGPTFGQACEELTAKRCEVFKLKPHEENERYVRAQFRWIGADLGHLFFAAFIPPVGDATLEDYRNRLAAEGYAPRSRSNRLSAVGQVLEYAWARGWLPKMPHLPEPTIGDELLSRPSTRVFLEGDFRTLRDRLWEDWPSRSHGLRKWLGNDEETITTYIARRKLYLSVAFYTGMHPGNLNVLDDSCLNPFRGFFLRSNTKSADCIKPAWLEMPEQLFLDVQAEIRRLGRPWHKGEAVAAGPWRNINRALRLEADRLNIPRPTPTVFRHSVAYHLCLMGWSSEQTARYLGHVDDRMVKTVYGTVLPGDPSPVKLDWTVANMRAVTGSIAKRAVVYDFQRAPDSHRAGPALHTLPDSAEDAPRGRGTPAAK